MSWDVDMNGWDVARALLKRLQKELQGPVIAKALHAAALQGEALTKISITEQGLIDTGFMRSSVYASSTQGSRYDEARAEAIQRNPDQDFGREIRPRRDSEAFLVVGAEYAPYVEANTPFLRPTLIGAGDELTQVVADTIMREIKDLL